MRLELGPRDMKENQYVVALRHNGEKKTLKEADLIASITSLLEMIQNDLKVYALL